MKPGPHAFRHKLLITGEELRQLQRHTWLMVEAFGLNRKIEKYTGTRPITLYRWDLECLIDVLSMALNDKEEYPDQAAPEYQALARLDQRLRKEYQANYPDQ